MSVNMGLPLFDKGYVNLTFDKQYSNFVQLGGTDSRLYGPNGKAPEGTIATTPNANGVISCSGGNCIPPANLALMPNYPYANPENSSPEIQQIVASYNAGYDFIGQFSLYSFGTWGHRYGIGHENYPPAEPEHRRAGLQPALLGQQSARLCHRLQHQRYQLRTSGTSPSCTGPYTLAGSLGAPGTVGAGVNANHIIISSGQNGTLYTPGELVQYPGGFQPYEAVKDTDYQYNLGATGNLAGWNVDASVSYGKDINDIYTLHSGNRSLFVDTHTTPTNFYDGTFVASQFIGTIDVTHQFDVGLAGPLNFAFGFEAREDTYEIKPGDAASQYKEGGQSYPGYSKPSAGSHSRKNYSAYVDFEFAPIETIDVDIAGRAEHYTDFGDTQIGKITARWDITPQIAVRGTMSTGFRAPEPAGGMVQHRQCVAHQRHACSCRPIPPPPRSWATRI